MYGAKAYSVASANALPQLGRDLQEALRGKIVDACNPSSGGDSAPAREAHVKGVGQTSAKILPGTRLVRAFTTAPELRRLLGLPEGN